MIILDIPPQTQAIIQHESEKAGMSIEQYIISKTISPAYQLSNDLELALQAEMETLTADDIADKPNVWQPSETQSEVISEVLNDSTPPNENLKAILALGNAQGATHANL